mmetsp:Transcript_72451/g.212310  ORF Transcript_72451/g.212310 Transcript_72451/m.212310 type:complete len:202 (+) Transcript_72451:749-1354(+)
MWGRARPVLLRQDRGGADALQGRCYPLGPSRGRRDAQVLPREVLPLPREGARHDLARRAQRPAHRGIHAGLRRGAAARLHRRGGGLEQRLRDAPRAGPGPGGRGPGGAGPQLRPELPALPQGLRAQHRQAGRRLPSGQDAPQAPVRRGPAGASPRARGDGKGHRVRGLRGGGAVRGGRVRAAGLQTDAELHGVLHEGGCRL